MKRTYGQKKRPYVASFADSHESAKKKTNRTSTPPPPSPNNTINDLVELLLDDTMEATSADARTKRNKMKDMAKAITGAVTKRLSSRKQISTYIDTTPLLSDSLNENVATESEDDDSLNSGGIKNSEGLTETNVKKSNRPNTIPRKPLPNVEVPTTYDASPSDTSPPFDPTGTPPTKDNMLTSDSFHTQEELANVEQNRTSAYEKLISGSSGFTNAFGMGTMDSSSNVYASNSELSRQFGAITVNTDDILTSSPAAQSTPNGQRRHHLRYPESQSHLREPFEVSASRNSEGTSNSDRLTPKQARIALGTKTNPTPTSRDLQSYSHRVLAMLDDSHLTPPTMPSLGAPGNSELQGSTVTDHVTPALGDKNVNAVMRQRVQDGAQRRRGLAHSGSFPSRLDQRRSKASKGNDKKDKQLDLMENDGSEDELQWKDPKYKL